jgi:hypothetical protein
LSSSRSVLRVVPTPMPALNSQLGPKSRSIDGTIRWEAFPAAPTLTVKQRHAGESDDCDRHDPAIGAQGTYSDGSTKTITSTVTWTSSNTSVATINSSGLAIGAAVGNATIRATLGSISGKPTLTVQPALVSIAITPANPSIKVGTSLQFTATGTYSDSSTKDLTSSVQWTTTKPGVATISASGLATAVTKGNATIKAKLGGITNATTLTVTP